MWNVCIISQDSFFTICTTTAKAKARHFLLLIKHVCLQVSVFIHLLIQALS